MPGPKNYEDFKNTQNLEGRTPPSSRPSAEELEESEAKARVEKTKELLKGQPQIGGSES